MPRLKALAAFALAAALLGACASSIAPIEPADAQPVTAPPSECATRQFVVYFSSWQAELNDDARASIATLQRNFSGCEIERVQIVGLAGAPGDQAANVQVSQQRAEAVAAALAAGGWPQSKFELSAHGEEGATLSDGSEAAMRRRAEVTVQAR